MHRPPRLKPLEATAARALIHDRPSPPSDADGDCRLSHRRAREGRDCASPIALEAFVRGKIMPCLCFLGDLTREIDTIDYAQLELFADVGRCSTSN